MTPTFRRSITLVLGWVATTALVLLVMAPRAGAAPVDFLVINDVSLTEGDAGTANLTFTISYTGPLNDITVDWSTADGTATAPADYGASSGTVSFTAASGSRSRTITVPVNGDLLDEANETFVVDLSNAQPADLVAISDAQGQGTINDNDPLPSLTVADAAVAEGTGGATNAVFVVTLTPASGRNVTMSYATSNGTAMQPGDYTSTSGSLTFTPGQTTRTISIPVAPDALDEADETFTMTLSSAGNATFADATAAGTIVDDDAPPTISIADASRTEGNSGTANMTFTLTLSAASGRTVTVAYATADGTALAPFDYTARTGTVTFTPGQLTRTFTVPVVGDRLDEFDETFLVDLSTPTNATIGDGQALGTIVDNDATPSLRVNDVTVTEGNGGAVYASFTVTLSAASGRTVSVDVATADGTALAPGDYAGVSTTLVFSPGQTVRPVVVTVNGDLLNEVNETYTVNLSNPVSATIADALGAGTITNDDETPSFSIDDVTVTEGNGGTTDAVFTVSLSAPSGRATVVRAATSDGTATSPADYATTTVTMTFPPGTASQTFVVPIVADPLDEPDETFVVSLSDVANATIADAQGTGTIADDDPLPALSIADASLTEGDAGTPSLTFMVTLEPASGRTVTVAYSTSDGTAMTPADYGSSSGSLSFDPGDTTMTFTVPIVGDTLDEFDETLLASLSGPVNATIGDDQAVGTIVDDDLPPALSIGDVTVAEGDAGTSIATFAVGLSAPSGKPISVVYATADGTATAGVDYGSASGILDFDPGEVAGTIEVTVDADVLDEFDETFALELSDPSNATPPPSPALGTIVDDDPPPTVSISDAAVLEGDAGVAVAEVSLTLSAPSGKPISVDVATSDGTASAGEDYTAMSTTVGFAEGQTAATVAVHLSGDDTYEADETLTLSLSGLVDADPGTSTATVTIVNDDPLPSVSVSGGELDEGNLGDTPFVSTVTLSNPSAFPVSVGYATSDGTAVAPEDYEAVGGTLDFAPGFVATDVVIAVHGDAAYENDESLTLTLADPTGATIDDGSADVTIRNDDAAPTIRIGDVTVLEGDGGRTNATFTLTLEGQTSLPASVEVATSDGSAHSSGGDYEEMAETVSFAPGEASGQVEVQINGDRIFEADEVFSVDLSDAIGAALGTEAAAGTIVNDDEVPGLVVGDAAVDEGDEGDAVAIVTISLTGPSAFPVSLDVHGMDGWATMGSDFAPIDTSITFEPGAVSKGVEVTIHGDVEIEGDESFSISISDQQGARMVDGEGMVTILDDDPGPTVLTVRGRDRRAATAIVKGRLDGAEPAAEVSIRLFVRRHHRWVAVDRRTSFTGEADGGFRAVFDVDGPGRYLVRAAYAGDRLHAASRATHRFRIRGA